MATAVDSAVPARERTLPRLKGSSDPRDYQIGALLGLLCYGLGVLDFDVPLVRITALVATTLLVQYLCGRLVGLSSFDMRSPLITAFSLSLLLRTDSLPLAVAGGVIAIGSKFALRIRGKHLFNPANIGIVALLALANGAWVSPGQWGSVAFFAFLVACVGGLVIHRSARAEVTLSFLFFWASFLVLRSTFLGEPLTIPAHRLESGTLLIFAFFMISDPKTTPNSRLGRVLFALIVASLAWYIAFRLFRTNALLWALALSSPLVPVLDRFLPGGAYQWQSAKRSSP
jgi:Na+-transporting NADH:ubiquinone oxidoreductase subunit NqrB